MNNLKSNSNNMKATIITFLFASIACAAIAQHEHSAASQAKDQTTTATFKNTKLGNAYTHYTHLKDALVASNADDAKKASEELEIALNEVKGSGDALTATTKLAATSDLEEQRQLFSSVSNEMTVLVKGGQLSSGSLYLEYCPMANNNEGAFWLSNEKQIKNPYFGDKMLKCGSVKETIH